MYTVGAEQAKMTVAPLCRLYAQLKTLVAS